MKIVHVIFLILDALLVGICMRAAAVGTDGWQIIYYAAATINAGFCFWHVNKYMEEK